MRIRYKLILFAILFGSLTSPARPAVEDTIVAVVNDEVITLNDLKDYIDAQTAQLRLEGSKPVDVQKFMIEMARNGLDRLIDDKILLNAANKHENYLNQSDPKGENNRREITEMQVEQRFTEIRSQYRSEEEFLKALIDQGVSVTDVRNRIRNQIKTKRLVDHQVRAKVHVNPQEITAYYKENFEQFQKPERVNLESIFIAKGEDAAANRQKIDELLLKIKSGADFKAIAAESSQAPSIGILKRGQLLPEIEKTVFNLNMDEISPVVEVENGFYIFQLKGRIKAELAPLDEVKDEIYGRVFQRKFQQRFDDWLQKLKKEAFVDIKKNI